MRENTKIVQANVSSIEGLQYFSIDPVTGEISLYSEKTNKQLINFDKEQNKVCKITEEWGNAEIYFKNKYPNIIHQITENGGYRTCFAKNIKKEQKIIKVCVKFIKEYNAWNIDNEEPFINYLILVDRSGSMGSKTSNGNTALKEGLININAEIIEPLKKEVKNDDTTHIRISFITFEQEKEVMLDDINLTADLDFSEMFSKIKIGGMTKLYDTVKYAIEIGEHIENECAFTNLIIVTDGMDTCSTKWNVNLHGKTKMNEKLDEKKNCSNSWNIVWIGLNSHNIESQNYGGGNNGIMNVGNQNMQQAFRSISCAINRTRTGEDSNVNFSSEERNASAPMATDNSSIFNSLMGLPTMGRQISNMNIANRSQNNFNGSAASDAADVSSSTDGNAADVSSSAAGNAAALPRLIIPENNGIVDDWQELENDAPAAPRCLNSNSMDTS